MPTLFEAGALDLYSKHTLCISVLKPETWVKDEHISDVILQAIIQSIACISTTIASSAVR